jgi:chromosome segregation ATPase
VARGGCGRITVDQRQLDRHVGALVVRILADPRHTEAIEAAAKATQDKRRPLRAELTECEHLADELSGRLGRREITLQRYDVAMAPLDKRIAELHAELAELGTACRQQPRTRPSRPRPVRNGRRDGTLPR